MSRIELAKVFCVAAHCAVGQKRRYSGEPYWVHPFAVAESVRDKGVLTVCAAYLHDTIEDTKVSYHDIALVFGLHVADIVLELTDCEVGNRAERKAAAVERLRVASDEAKTVKVADLIDNTMSIVVDDPDFAVLYMAEKREMLKVLRCPMNEDLWLKANKIVEDYYEDRSIF